MMMTDAHRPGKPTRPLTEYQRTESIPRDVLTFKGNSREETYSWIERTLRTCSYFSRHQSEKKD